MHAFLHAHLPNPSNQPIHTVLDHTSQEVNMQFVRLLQDDRKAFEVLSFLDDRETHLQKLRGEQLLGHVSVYLHVNMCMCCMFLYV
ncbi:hypothetical protein EON65_40290 [archaeon]|nr:MAG: hypothetical protein EON65_40290 [archaeon]